MKKILALTLIGFLSILNAGCKDDSKDWSGVVVDYEKARNDLRQRQAHFLRGTSFQLRFNALTPRAFVEEDRNGIRRAIVAHNSDSMSSADVTVHCKKQQYVWRPFLSKAVAEVQTPKRGTQGYIVMVNICSLPTTPALSANLDREIKWKP